MPGQVGRYWMLTIPHHQFTPYLPEGLGYLKGQLEEGEGGFVHWQVLAVFPRNQRLAAVRTIFGPVHAELTRSAAADDYVWKEESRIDGTQFELGQRALRRGHAPDWEAVRNDARAGRLDAIPGDIYVRCYNQVYDS